MFVRQHVDWYPTGCAGYRWGRREPRTATDGTLASDRSMMSLVVFNDKRRVTKEAIDLCSTCNVLKSCSQVLAHLTSRTT